jgi:hypothetical protein
MFAFLAIHMGVVITRRRGVVVGALAGFVGGGHGDGLV